jgi:hypothetical protein
VLHLSSSPRIADLERPEAGPVAATALSALLPDQVCQHLHGLKLLQKLERHWPAFKLQQLAESVDRQYVRMGLGIHYDFPLLPRCKNLGNEPPPMD